TVILTITTNAAYIAGSPASGTVTIIDNDLPAVTISATTPSASEALTNGVVRVTRTGCLTSALTVNYKAGGTASNGLDCVSLANSVIIPAAQSNVTITISPLPDDLVEGTETATLTLTAGSGYTVASPSNATVNI